MLKIKVSFSDLKKIAKLPNIKNKEYREKIKRVVINLSEYVIGEAKENTTIGKYEPYIGKGGKKIKTGITGGTLRNAWTRTEVKRYNKGYKTKIFNPVEYAQYYEYGHRQTPGRYVPQIGKRLKASFVKGRYPLQKAIYKGRNSLDKFIEHEFKR